MTKTDINTVVEAKDKELEAKNAELEKLKKEMEDLKSQGPVGGPSQATASETEPGWLRPVLESLVGSMTEDRKRVRVLEKELADLRVQMQEDSASNSSSKFGTSQARGPKPQAPPKLQADVTLRAFKVWRKSFEDFAKMCSLETMDDDMQMSTLRACFSQEMLGRLPHAVKVSDVDDVQAVLDKVQLYFRSKRNIALDVVEFYNRRQLENESFDAYLTAIHEIAEDAELTEGLCTNDGCAVKAHDRFLTARVESKMNQPDRSS